MRKTDGWYHTVHSIGGRKAQYGYHESWKQYPARIHPQSLDGWEPRGKGTDEARGRRDEARRLTVLQRRRGGGPCP